MPWRDRIVEFACVNRRTNTTAMNMRAKKVEITSDGWAVTDLRTFRFLVDHPPPRPYGVWDQIREDAGSWTVVGLWVAVAGFVTAGVVTGQWLFLAPAFGLASVWATGCRIVVRDVRNSPVAVGIVDALEPHPLLPGSSTALARLAEERQVPVTVETVLIRDIIDSGGQAEAMFLDDPKTQYSRVIGVRAVKPG
jgi:hypothetical protein